MGFEGVEGWERAYCRRAGWRVVAIALAFRKLAELSPLASYTMCRGFFLAVLAVQNDLA